MSLDDTGYDYGVYLFSPEGRIYQIEYAQRVVEESGNIIALKGKDCIVFAVENLLHSKLYEKDTATRLFNLDGKLGFIVAGFLPDGRHLLDIARMEASYHKQYYGEKISTERLKTRLSLYIHTATLSSMYRPFGVNIIVGSFEQNVPKLTCIDSSGASKDYIGCALGKASEATKSDIQELDLKNMGPSELIREAARIIYTVRDEVRDKGIVELGWIGKNTGGKFEKVPDNVFEDAVRYATAAIQEY